MEKPDVRRAWLFAVIVSLATGGCGPDQSEVRRVTGAKVELERIQYYVDPADSAIAAFELSDGRVVGYFGEKDPDGRATRIDRMVVATQTDSPTVAEIELDERGRPVRGRVSGRGEMLFDWSTEDTLRITVRGLTATGEEREVTRAFALEELREMKGYEWPTITVGTERTSAGGGLRTQEHRLYLAGAGGPFLPRVKEPRPAPGRARPDGTSDGASSDSDWDRVRVTCGCKGLCGTRLKATWGGFPLEVEETAGGRQSAECTWRVGLPSLQPDAGEVPEVMTEEVCPVLTSALVEFCQDAGNVMAAVTAGTALCAALIELPPVAVVCEILVLSIPFICAFSPLIDEHGCDLLGDLIDQIVTERIVVHYTASHPVWGEATAVRQYRLSARGRTMLDGLRRSPILELPGCDLTGIWREVNEGVEVRISQTVTPRRTCQRNPVWLGRPTDQATCPVDGSPRNTFFRAWQYGRDIGKAAVAKLRPDLGLSPFREPDATGQVFRCTGEDGARLITDCGAYEDPVRQGFQAWLADPNLITGPSYAPVYDAKEHLETGEWFDCVRRAQEYQEVPLELRRVTDPDASEPPAPE